MAKDKGFEYLDDSPVEVPVRLRRRSAEGWAEMVQAVAKEMSRRAAEQKDETLEDSLDFGEDDDEFSLPISQSEMRYLKEEELLTEALEAAKLRTARHRVEQMKKEIDRGKRRAEGGKERERSEVDEGRDESGKSGSVDAVQEPEKKS